MNTEYFIAKRLVKGGPGSYSGPIIRIAIISVALGLAVMIVSVAIVTGFQREIKEKVSGFGSHIQIAKFDSNNSFEFAAINKDQPLYHSLPKIDGIRHVQVFATKAGIIKTNDQIQGVIFKGV
jgi:lipoprotein-releasing system permease protein